MLDSEQLKEPNITIKSEEDSWVSNQSCIFNENGKLKIFNSYHKIINIDEMHLSFCG